MQSVQASATGSLFTRAAYIWASDLASEEVDIPKDLKDEIKKNTLAAAFAADASVATFHLPTRAMSYNVIARQNTWLRNWEVDSSAQAKVSAVAFRGVNLFGHTLDCCLIEDKDKKKVLPSKRKESKSRKCFCSFRKPGPHHNPVTSKPSSRPNSRRSSEG